MNERDPGDVQPCVEQFRTALAAHGITPTSPGVDPLPYVGSSPNRLVALGNRNFATARQLACALSKVADP